MSAYSFQGKHIWLIGASYGIGEALAEQLAEAGAILTLSARSQERIKALALRLGNGARAVMCDVTDNASVVAAYQQCPQPDMVIYNAGTYEPMSSAQFDLESVMQMIDVNLMGAVRVLHAILPAMRAAGSGEIALVGSVAGYRGLPKAMGYGLSKAALIHLTENLRQDLDGSGITVHLINPGFVKTRLTEKNSFSMPFMVTPAEAAIAIMKGLRAGKYEIHFPGRLTWPMKMIAALPSSLYFWLSKKIL